MSSDGNCKRWERWERKTGPADEVIAPSVKSIPNFCAIIDNERLLGERTNWRLPSHYNSEALVLFPLTGNKPNNRD